MRDIYLAIEIRTALLAQLALYGVGAIRVEQVNQPTQEGAPVGPAILFSKLFDKRYGSPQKKDTYNPESGQFDHVQSVQVETTYQFAALAPDDPTDLTGYRAADYLKTAAAALQSDTLMTALRAKGVGVQRIGEIRDTPFQNELGVNESNPTFDVVLTHRDAYIEIVPAVVASEVNINRV